MYLFEIKERKDGKRKKRNAKKRYIRETDLVAREKRKGRKGRRRMKGREQDTTSKVTCLTLPIVSYCTHRKRNLAREDEE